MCSLIEIAKDVFGSSSAGFEFGLFQQIFFVQFPHFSSFGARVPIQTQDEHRVVQHVHAQQRHAHLRGKWEIYKKEISVVRVAAPFQKTENLIQCMYREETRFSTPLDDSLHMIFSSSSFHKRRKLNARALKGSL